MEKITIQENNRNYIMFFVGKKIKVQIFDKEHLKKPLQFLKYFSLSPSSYIIQEKKNEKILYDPESNLYHRLVNNKEDWSYLFHYNGEDYSKEKLFNTQKNNLGN